MGWSLGTLGALFAVWISVGFLFGDNLEVIEALTRRPQGLHGWGLWIGLSMTAGICEEYIVRGYGIGFLRRWGINPWFAAVVTSVLFGALHFYQGLHAVYVIAVWGFVFAVPYLKTGSLLPGVIAHAAVDAVAPFFIGL